MGERKGGTNLEAKVFGTMGGLKTSKERSGWMNRLVLAVGGKRGTVIEEARGVGQLSKKGVETNREAKTSASSGDSQR